MIVTVSIFVLQVLVALPAAYALAKLRFLGRDVLFALVLFCILIPPQATAIPVFLLLHKLGVLDSLRGAGAALHDLGVRHLPDAAVLQDRARRSRSTPRGWTAFPSSASSGA